MRDSHFKTGLALDIRSVLYSKMLINLQSAVNALCGRPVPWMLAHAGYRRAWRGLILEALEVYAAAGIKPTKPYISALPWLLAMPDWAYNPLARCLFPLDPMCKSSMLQDIEGGRATEVDTLNGEVLRLAAENAKARGGSKGRGTSAPLNAAMVTLVKELEAGTRRRMGPNALTAHLASINKER